MRGVLWTVAFGCVLALLQGGATAASQTPDTAFSLELRMSPKRPGSMKQPRPIDLSAALLWTTNGDNRAAPPITGVRILLPRAMVFNGDRHPACPRRLALREGGVANCPERSVIGGTGLFQDYLGELPRVTFANGGKRRIWAFATANFAGSAVFPIALRQPRDRRWGTEVELQAPIGSLAPQGPPYSLFTGWDGGFQFFIGGEQRVPGYLTSSGRCPRRGFFGYRLSVRYLKADASAGISDSAGRLSCRGAART